MSAVLVALPGWIVSCVATSSASAQSPTRAAPTAGRMGPRPTGSPDTIPTLETGGRIPMPPEWIDRDTGHRVVRLTRSRGASRSFYFHNDPFLAGRDGTGESMVYYGDTPQGPQLFLLDLGTLESRQLTQHPRGVSGEIVGRRRRSVFYQARDTVFSTDVDTGETRVVYVFPTDYLGHISTLNADETLLAGVKTTPEEREILRRNPGKGSYFEKIFEAHLPHTIFTIDVDRGTLAEVHEERAWLNHLFSPTRPDLLMYCHEGPWHLVDRIWTLDLATGDVTKIHERTVDREIAGHEFWSRDGNTIWYDLQIPRGVTFFLAGDDISTGTRTRYRMTRDEWSIHFAISPDQTLFAGDGDDSTQVAEAHDGMWIYLFRPAGDHLVSERLVNMSHQDYDLEPNVHFSPDGKSVIFRANFEGESQVYAVSIAAEGH